MGTGERSSRAVAVFRLCGQCSTGPRGVADQSKFRIRAVVSAAPALGYAFGKEGLAKVRQPLQLWRAAECQWRSERYS